MGIPIYELIRTTSYRAQSLRTHNVPCLNEEVDCFGVPIVVVINDTRHLHDLESVWEVAMKVTNCDNTSLVLSGLSRKVRMRRTKEPKACIQARNCNCQEQKPSSSLWLRHRGWAVAESECKVDLQPPTSNLALNRNGRNGQRGGS